MHVHEGGEATVTSFRPDEQLKLQGLELEVGGTCRTGPNLGQSNGGWQVPELQVVIWAGTQPSQCAKTLVKRQTFFSNISSCPLVMSQSPGV